MSEMSVSLGKAVVVIIVACSLSSVSTWGVINAVPSLVATQDDNGEIVIIRFHELGEINVSGTHAQGVATFVWIPNNPESNMILAVYAHFEYYYENPPPVWEESRDFRWELRFTVSVNEFRGMHAFVGRAAPNMSEWEREAFKWKQTCFKAQPSHSARWILPNQNNYTLWFQVSHTDHFLSSIPTYVRNINLIVEALDGLPEDNQNTS